MTLEEKAGLMLHPPIFIGATRPAPQSRQHAEGHNHRQGDRRDPLFPIGFGLEL